MAIKIREEITLTGETVIDDVKVESYQATISSDNPGDSPRFGRSIRNEALRKANHETCMANQLEFEKQVYAKQDEMMEG